MVVQNEVEIYLYSFFNLGSKLGCLVNATPRQIYILERDPLPIVQRAGRATGPVWTGADNLPPQVFEPLTVHAV